MKIFEHENFPIYGTLRQVNRVGHVVNSVFTCQTIAVTEETHDGYSIGLPCIPSGVHKSVLHGTLTGKGTTVIPQGPLNFHVAVHWIFENEF